MLDTLRSWLQAIGRKVKREADTGAPRYEARHERRRQIAHGRLFQRAHARMVLLCGAGYSKADVYRMHRRGALTAAKAHALGAQIDPSRRAA